MIGFFEQGHFVATEIKTHVKWRHKPSLGVFTHPPPFPHYFGWKFYVHDHRQARGLVMMKSPRQRKTRQIFKLKLYSVMNFICTRRGEYEYSKCNVSMMIILLNLFFIFMLFPVSLSVRLGMYRNIQGCSPDLLPYHRLH